MAARTQAETELLQPALLLQVFLKVDTGFSNGELGIKAYVSKSMSLGSLQLGTEFAEIELQTQTTNLQKISSMPTLTACTQPCTAWVQA